MTTLAQLLGRGPVSIQKITITNQPGYTTNHTIAAVDLSRSAVFIGTIGAIKSGINSSQVGCARLTSANNIETPSGAGVGAKITQDIYVVDFGLLVKSVQRGVMAATFDKGEAALAPVNPSRCIVTLMRNMTEARDVNTTHQVTSDKLTITWGSNTVGNLHWQVIEFY